MFDERPVTIVCVTDTFRKKLRKELGSMVDFLDIENRFESLEGTCGLPMGMQAYPIGNESQVETHAYYSRDVEAFTKAIIAANMLSEFDGEFKMSVSRPEWGFCVMSIPYEEFVNNVFTLDYDNTEFVD